MRWTVRDNKYKHTETNTHRGTRTAHTRARDADHSVNEEVQISLTKKKCISRCGHIFSVFVLVCFHVPAWGIPQCLRTGWSIPSIKLTLFVLIWITYRSHGTATKIDSLVLLPFDKSVNLWNSRIREDTHEKKNVFSIEEVSYEWMKNEIVCNKTQHGVYQSNVKQKKSEIKTLCDLWFKILNAEKWA